MDGGEGGFDIAGLSGQVRRQAQQRIPGGAVGVFIDGVYAARSGGALMAFNDVERVEVLKGPQGTLFGQGSQAGTIRIITKKPDASGFSAGYSFELNSVNDGGNGHIAEGYLNAPISPSAAIRVVAGL